MEHDYFMFVDPRCIVFLRYRAEKQTDKHKHH